MSLGAPNFFLGGGSGEGVWAGQALEGLLLARLCRPRTN